MPQNTKTPSIDDLITVSKIFKNVGLEFALGGSGLMHALGLTVTVHDWDLTTDEPWNKVEPLLRNFDFRYLEADEFYATKYRCKFKVGNSNIDLMGGFAIKTDAGIHHVATEITGQWQGVPMGSPEAWALAYKLMGRSEKAEMLSNWVNAKQTELKKPLITLESHHAEWKNSFFKLKSKVDGLFGSVVKNIDHFGSTSIPGIAAKPIIDMIGLTTSLSDLDQKISLGLPTTITCLGENGVVGRRYFVIEMPGEPRAHLHLFEVGNQEYDDRVLFRDFLRENHIAAKEYEQIKLKLSASHAEDPVAYWMGKQSFAKSTLEHARLSKSNSVRGTPQ